MTNLTFLELLSRYDGGIAALAHDTEIGLHTLYRIIRGEHRKRPMQHLSAIRHALQQNPIKGQSLTEKRLLALWKAAALEHEEGVTCGK